MKMRDCVSGTCPFCGRLVRVGVLSEIEDGDEGFPPDVLGEEMVLHGDPQCPVFQRLSGEQFLDAMIAKEKRRGRA